MSAIEPQVTVTARYLLDHGLWPHACEVAGLDLFAVVEGRMDDSETVTLTLAQVTETGLLDELMRDWAAADEATGDADAT